MCTAAVDRLDGGSLGRVTLAGGVQSDAREGFEVGGQAGVLGAGGCGGDEGRRVVG